MTAAQEPGPAQPPTQPSPEPQVEIRRLYRSRTNRVLSGVCGGIAEHYGSDPGMVRLLAVILDILTGIFPLLIAYLVAAILIPERGAVIQGAAAPQGWVPVTAQPSAGVEPGRIGMIFGIILVTVGLAAYAREVLDVDWDQIWPLMLIGLGGLLLLASFRR